MCRQVCLLGLYENHWCMVTYEVLSTTMSFRMAYNDGQKDRTFDSSRFSAEGTLISSSAVRAHEKEKLSWLVV